MPAGQQLGGLSRAGKTRTLRAQGIRVWSVNHDDGISEAQERVRRSLRTMAAAHE